MNQIPWLHFSEAWSGASSPAELAIQALLRIEVLLTHTYKPWMPWKSQNYETTEMLKLQLLRNTILNLFLDSDHLFLQLLIHHFQLVSFISNLLPDQPSFSTTILISTGGSDPYFPSFLLQSTFSDPRYLVFIQFWVLLYFGPSLFQLILFVMELMLKKIAHVF